MKILLVHNRYQQPGGEDVVFDQERELLESAGHQVATYCRTNWEIEEDSAAGRIWLVDHVIWNADTRQDFKSLLLAEKPQLVHVHNTFTVMSPSVYAACKALRLPVVQTLHNYRLLCPAATFFRNGKVCEECVDHSLWRAIRYGCYRGSHSASATVALMLALNRVRGTWTSMIDCYVALSEFARQKFIAGGLPPERIVVKPNFVHPDPGTREGIGEYALFVGRLSPEKGLRTLLAAWQRLQNQIPLFIVGNGPLRAELQQQAIEHGLSHINFLGQLAREQAAETMKTARFVILPSEWYENSPMTVIEAFASSTPVICSRLGAIQEIVEHSRTGLLVSPSDPDGLATTVEWAWAHPEAMEAMGREARGEYERKYTPARNYEILMQIYQRTIRSVALARPADATCIC